MHRQVKMIINSKRQFPNHTPKMLGTNDEESTKLKEFHSNPYLSTTSALTDQRLALTDIIN